jgi:hypothetical protein
MWQALNELNTAVQRDLDAVAKALNDADKRMAGGKGDAWVGPTARPWGSDLAGAASDISRQAMDFAADVRRALAARPKEVTSAAADTERRILTGRIR